MRNSRRNIGELRLARWAALGLFRMIAPGGDKSVQNRANPCRSVQDATLMQQTWEGLGRPLRQLMRLQQDTSEAGSGIFFAVAFCCISLHRGKFGEDERGDAEAQRRKELILGIGLSKSVLRAWAQVCL